MAARILEFPKRAEAAPEVVQACVTAIQQSHNNGAPEPGPRLVKAGSEYIAPVHTHSQQQALQIVQESRQDAKRLPDVKALISERSPQFWANLPVPEERMETPLTVARRLAHLILSSSAQA
jgi:hypothetical protein